MQLPIRGNVVFFRRLHAGIWQASLAESGTENARRIKKRSMTWRDIFIDNYRSILAIGGSWFGTCFEAAVRYRFDGERGPNKRRFHR